MKNTHTVLGIPHNKVKTDYFIIRKCVDWNIIYCCFSSCPSFLYRIKDIISDKITSK